MLVQCDWSFSMPFTPSSENPEINLLLYISIFACKRFLMAFFTPLLFLDNLGVLHKFLSTGNISFLVTLQGLNTLIRRLSGSPSSLNLIIFDLYNAFSNFAVNLAHILIGFFLVAVLTCSSLVSIVTATR